MKALTVLSGFVFCGSMASSFAQGSLTPPGAPAPTMKSLNQIEPRTPIASLPYTITNSGSYYVTGNLTGAANTNGISIQASNVTIDLGGFTLIGPSNSVYGIYSAGPYKNIAVRHGVVRGWTGFGVYCPTPNGQFEDLHVEGNGFGGIFTGSNCVVARCIAEGNGWGIPSYGITVSSGSLVRDCVSGGNLGGGFNLVSGGSVIVNCVAGPSPSLGFEIGSDSTISQCVVTDNALGGIFADSGTTVKDCTASRNAAYGIFGNIRNRIHHCTVANNTGHGIDVGPNSEVVDNYCTGNGNGTTNTAGIFFVGSGSRIEGNHLAGNSLRGIKTFASGNILVRNTVRGSTVNYDLAGANAVGQILVATNGVTITNANPWANFEF
jgi:parallel beta-helix repeat protein